VRDTRLGVAAGLVVRGCARRTRRSCRSLVLRDRAAQPLPRRPPGVVRGDRRDGAFCSKSLYSKPSSRGADHDVESRDSRLPPGRRGQAPRRSARRARRAVRLGQPDRVWRRDSRLGDRKALSSRMIAILERGPAGRSGSHHSPPARRRPSRRAGSLRRQAVGARPASIGHEPARRRDRCCRLVGVRGSTNRSRPR
jgi:hypothetical protein